MADCISMIWLNFEWDESKAESNDAKHGVSFKLASMLFSIDGCIEIDVSRGRDGEPRWKRTGLLAGVLTTVVFTRRENRIRLISARRANKGEERRYGDRSLQL